MYPKGQIKDRGGNIIQQGDVGTGPVLWFASFPSDEEAKEFGRKLWRQTYVGKQKRIKILKDLPDNPQIPWINNYEILLEHDNIIKTKPRKREKQNNKKKTRK